MTRGQILFSSESGKVLEKFNVIFNDSYVCQKVLEELPIMYRLCYWGESLWLQLPFAEGTIPEGDTVEIQEGDIAYWLPGQQVHIYFGKTPASTASEPKPLTPVSVIGRIVENPGELKALVKSIPRRHTYITLDRINYNNNEEVVR